MGRRKRFDPSMTNPYSIRAVERVCDLLDLLRGTPDGISLIRAAEVVSMPKSTAFRYLATLEARRYVERTPRSGNYRLGSAFLALQPPEPETLVQQAHPHLEELRHRIGETVILAALEGRRVAYLDLLESPRSVRVVARRGDHFYLHSSATGKAVAATMPDQRVRSILESVGMPRRTSRTITDIDTYIAELSRVRAVGYAFDDQEHDIDLRGLAAPLREGRIHAALGISAPAIRLPTSSIKTMADPLVETAAHLTAELGVNA